MVHAAHWVLILRRLLSDFSAAVGKRAPILIWALAATFKIFADVALIICRVHSERPLLELPVLGLSHWRWNHPLAWKRALILAHGLLGTVEASSATFKFAAPEVIVLVEASSVCEASSVSSVARGTLVLRATMETTTVAASAAALKVSTAATGHPSARLVRTLHLRHRFSEFGLPMCELTFIAHLADSTVLKMPAELSLIL